jgi:cell division protein ZapA
MTQEGNNSSVQVEIFDRKFKLHGSDPEYILKLAEYVDAKMRTLVGKAHTADSARLAVLAALNIAEEYHLLKAKLNGGVSDSSMSNHSSEGDRCEEKMPEGEEWETSGEEVHLMTEEDKQRVRERRQRHYTKRRYEKELLAIVNDESVPAKERHEALFTLGRVRGYHRRPTGKRRA